MTLTTEQLTKIAREHGTPTYVYDGDLIREQYRKLRDAIPWEQKRILYAMKANSNPHLLKILLEEGAGIDAVSPAEVRLALRVGFPSEKVMFTGNNMADEEMSDIEDTGVLLNIGSLSRLEKYAKAFPDSDVCVRFNPDVVAAGHVGWETGGQETKFGIRIERVDEVVDIARRYGLRIVGVHEHTGSGIPEEVDMEKGLNNLLDVIDPERFPDLQFVNFGGGFKIPYKPDESPFDIERFGKDVSERFARFCEEYGRSLEMQFEPGRYLVAQAGYLVVKVTTLKGNNGKAIAGVDSGFGHLQRPMFYGAYHRIVNLSNPDGESQVYDIVGNICESGDHFASNRELPEIREGDILAILDAGAYGYSMASGYNMRPLPAEVLVGGKRPRVIRPRVSARELVDTILAEVEF